MTVIRSEFSASLAKLLLRRLSMNAQRVFPREWSASQFLLTRAASSGWGNLREHVKALRSNDNVA